MTLGKCCFVLCEQNMGVHKIVHDQIHVWGSIFAISGNRASLALQLPQYVAISSKEGIVVIKEVQTLSLAPTNLQTGTHTWK